MMMNEFGQLNYAQKLRTTIVRCERFSEDFFYHNR